MVPVDILGKCFTHIGEPVTLFTAIIRTFNCLSNVSKLAIVKEFFCFLRVRKKWWLAPIVLFLLLLGALLIFAEGSAIAPFIYSLF